MPSSSDRLQQAEHNRRARGQRNHRQPFLKLPAEIRNRIYETHLQSIAASTYCFTDTCIIALTDEFGDLGMRFYRKTFSPLLQLCQQIRAEFLPIFFSKVTATLDLEAMIGSSVKADRKSTFLDILCDRAIARIGTLHIQSTAKCFGKNRSAHGDPMHNCYNGVYIIVERNSECVRLGYPNGYLSSSKGALSPQGPIMKAVEHLMAQIRSMNLHKLDHNLCQEDFKKLAREMNWSTFRKTLWKFMRSDAV